MKRPLRCLSALIAVAALHVPIFAQGPIRTPLTPTEEERIFCDACSVLRPDLLPDDRRPAHVPTVARCGTAALQAVVSNWDRLSAGTRAKLTTFLQRPSNQRSFASPSGRFLVHYDVSGFHGVDTADSDGNGVPDYVDLVADTFDDVWTREIDGLGYRAPPDDGDGVYDIHIQQLGLQGVYGLTFSTPGMTISPSHIQIDNDFTDNIFATRGTAGVQVTAAHEFYHAIQFAYYAPLDAGWWQELTATWMEDVMFDDVNDYYQYQPFFFQSPETSLDQFTFGSLQPFAASVFGHYLQDVYGVDVVRDTWDTMATRTPATYEIEDVDTGLPGGFAEVLPRFIVWNYLTGGRHLAGYYEEGAVYQEVKPIRPTPVSGLSVTGSDRINHLASTYFAIDTKSLSGGLKVDLTLESGSTYEVIVIHLRNGSPEVVYLPGNSITIANVSRYDEVVIAPLSTSLSGSNFDVDYTILNSGSLTQSTNEVGDFDRDGSVAFADFLAFAESFGKPVTDAGHVRAHDLNADGEIGFGDFLVFASHFGE